MRGRYITKKDNIKSKNFIKQKGQKVLKMEMDLRALPFDKDNMVTTVDESTYAKFKDGAFANGIEVKVLSRLLDSAPDFARAFIGIAFHIDDSNTNFQSI